MYARVIVEVCVRFGVPLISLTACPRTRVTKLAVHRNARARSPQFRSSEYTSYLHLTTLPSSYYLQTSRMPRTQSRNALSEQNRANASYPHHITPQKARIREAAFILRTTGTWDRSYNLGDIFKRHEVS